MIDNFKDYPVTIGEARSDKTESPTDWTPRDALITLLRRIDNGLVLSEFVIGWEQENKGETSVHYMTTSHRVAGLGLLARIMWLMNQS